MVHPVCTHMFATVFAAMKNPRGHGHSRCLAKGEAPEQCQKLISVTAIFDRVPIRSRCGMYF